VDPARRCRPDGHQHACTGLALLAAASGVDAVYYLASAMLAGPFGSLPAGVAGVPLPAMVGLQPALRSRRPRGAAAVADGVVLDVIHIGYWSHGPADLVAFVLTVGLVAAMSVLFHGSWWQRPDVAARGRDLGRGAARA
jgi:hypothetical protein